MKVSQAKNVISSLLREYFNDLKILVDVHEDESLTLDLTHYVSIRGQKKETILGSIRMELSQYNPIFLDGKQLFHVHSFVNQEGQGLGYGKDLYCCAINIAAREKTAIISGPLFESTKSDDALAMTHKLIKDKNIKTQPVLAVVFYDGETEIVALAKISEFERKDIIRQMKIVEKEMALLTRKNYSEVLESILSRQKDPIFQRYKPKNISICYVHHTDSMCNVSVPVEFIGKENMRIFWFDHHGSSESASEYADRNSMITMKRMWVYLIRANDKLEDDEKIPQKKILAIAKKINDIENSENFDRDRVKEIISDIKRLIQFPSDF